MPDQIEWVFDHEVTAGDDYGGSLGYYTDERFLREILSFVPKSAEKVCDVGCGSGIVGLYIKDNIGKNVEVTFLDINIEQLMGINRGDVRVIEADILDYEPTEQYDCVVSRLLNHYFPKGRQQEVVDNTYDMVSEGGCYINALPLAVDDETQNAVNGMFSILEREVTGKNPHRHVMKKEEAMGIWHVSGFKNVEVHENPNHKLTHYIDEFKGKFSLGDDSIKKIEDFLLKQPAGVADYMGIEKIGERVRIAHPMYIMTAVK